jgi:DNA-binding transcriptional regulator YhcF (GntR family)
MVTFVNSCASWGWFALLPLPYCAILSGCLFSLIKYFLDTLFATLPRKTVLMTATSTASQSRDKLHLQLARLFRNKIATGEWPVGQSIPTVEELEALHSVSRTTVRMAVHALVDEGLLETRKRGGTKVVGQPYKPPSFLLPTTWQELVAFGEQIQQTTLQQANDCVPPIPAGFLPWRTGPCLYLFFARAQARRCTLLPVRAVPGTEPLPQAAGTAGAHHAGSGAGK